MPSPPVSPPANSSSSSSSTSTAQPQPPAKEIKPANKPFLVHQRHKQRQADAAKAKRAGGGKSGPTSSSFVGSVLKWTVLALVTSAVMSRALTQSWLFGYEGKWSNPKNIYSLIFPDPPTTFSEHQLALHDGTQPDKYPLYIAIDGEVYDISDGGMRMYGPGGAYSPFAGKDAARAFVTGCFQTHLTHDLRGFTEKDMVTLNNWKTFYANHAKYRKVGTVVHPPIDPNSPIPEPCNQGKDQPGGKEKGK
ncbi:hypothetical protein JCM8097_002533 [Rhodosporidiobolus ruineniae]